MTTTTTEANYDRWEFQVLAKEKLERPQAESVRTDRKNNFWLTTVPIAIQDEKQLPYSRNVLAKLSLAEAFLAEKSVAQKS